MSDGDGRLDDIKSSIPSAFLALASGVAIIFIIWAMGN